MYRCLFKEISGCFIWPEHSHDRTGRVDFLIPDRRWAIELLQNGTKGQILEHVDRFDELGKYEMRGIFDECIIFNFCYLEKRRDLRKTSKTIIEVLSFSRELMTRQV